MTHIVGMPPRRANKTSRRTARDPVERLRDSVVVGPDTDGYRSYPKHVLVPIEDAAQWETVTVTATHHRGSTTVTWISPSGQPHEWEFDDPEPGVQWIEEQGRMVLKRLVRKGV